MCKINELKGLNPKLDYLLRHMAYFIDKGDCVEQITEIYICIYFMLLYQNVNATDTVVWYTNSRTSTLTQVLYILHSQRFKYY